MTFPMDCSVSGDEDGVLCRRDLSCAQFFLSLLILSLIVLVSLDSGARFLQLCVVVARVTDIL